ncbi:hypothetical protein JXB22_03270, partial [candidate division WOR-3 bacterium]|nr:hypothetical protein [candidate division WOR-3 bacterium]
MCICLLSVLFCAPLHLHENALVTKPVIAHDPWFSQDKFMHFSVSAALTGYSYYASIKHLDM